MVGIFVGIGSNLRRERNVRLAVSALREHFQAVRCSTVYETAALGFDGDPFFNLVAGFESDESCPRVVSVLHRIEDDLGRDRTAPSFSDRVIDLDLLLYGDAVRDSAPVLPRPEILERDFVLGPLAELAPALRHPTDGRTLAELWSAFPRSGERLHPVDFDPGACAVPPAAHQCARRT